MQTGKRQKGRWAAGWGPERAGDSEADRPTKPNTHDTGAGTAVALAEVCTLRGRTWKPYRSHEAPQQNHSSVKLTEAGPTPAPAPTGLETVSMTR